jgi:hypothetical protein
MRKEFSGPSEVPLKNKIIGVCSTSQSVSVSPCAFICHKRIGLSSVLMQLGTTLRTTLLNICCPRFSLAWFVQQQKSDYSLSVEPEKK